MAGPWEKYRQPEGPWTRYGGSQQQVSAMETVGDVAVQFGEGVNKTIERFLFDPGRAVDAGIEAATGLKRVSGAEGRRLRDEAMPGFLRPFSRVLNAPTDLLQQGAEQLSDYLSRDTEARTKAGRVAQTAGGVLAESAPLAAATFGFAPAIQAATRGAQSALPQVIGNIARTTQATPGRAATAELVSTLGAGTGIGLAREDKTGPVGEVISGLVGAVTPAGIAAGMRYSPVSMAVRGIRSRLSPAAQKAAAEQNVQDTFSQYASRIDPDKIAESEAIGKDIPGLKMTLAEKSEMDELIKAQSKASQNLPQDTLEAETARRAGNQRAVEEARIALAPEGQYDPDSILDVAAGNIGKARGQITAERQGLVGQEQNIADDLVAEGLKSRTTGENLRTAIKGKRLAVKQKMSAMAQSMGLNDKSAEIDFSSVAKAMKSAYDQASSLQVARKNAADEEPFSHLILSPRQRQEHAAPQAQESVKNVHTGKSHPTMAILDDLADNQSVNGITQLRSEIAEELEILYRNPNPGNASQRRGLSAALKTLDDFIDAPIDSGTGLAAAIPDEAIAQNYQAFRNAYRTEYADNFERGAIYKGLQKDGRRAYRVRDEELAASFFKPGDEQAALQYKKVFGNDPFAMQALESTALDSLASKIGKNGVLTEETFNAWMRRHNSVLQHYPEIKNRLGSHRQAIREIGERREVLRMREEQIERNILTKAINSIDNTGAGAEEFLQKALGKPRLMNELVSALSPAGAGSLPVSGAPQRNALARTVWERVLKEQNPAEFARKHVQSLKIALGPEYFRRLSNLTRAIEKIAITDAPTSKGFQAQPLVSKVEELLNTGLNQVSSRIFAVNSGRTSTRSAGADVAGRVIRGYSQRQANQVLIEAMLNPELAARFTEVVKTPLAFAPKKRLYTYLFAIGIRPDSSDQPDKKSGE